MVRNGGGRLDAWLRRATSAVIAVAVLAPATPALGLSPLPPKYDPQASAVGTWCGQQDQELVGALTVDTDGKYSILAESPGHGTWQVGTYSIVLHSANGGLHDNLELKSAVTAAGPVLHYRLQGSNDDVTLQRCKTEPAAVTGSWKLRYDPDDVAARWQWPAVTELTLGADAQLANNRLTLTTGPAAGLTLVNLHVRGDYLIAQTPLLVPRDPNATVPMQAMVFLQPAKPGLIDLAALLGENVDKQLFWSAKTQQLATVHTSIQEGFGETTLTATSSVPDTKPEQWVLVRYPAGSNGVQFRTLAAANRLLAERGFVPASAAKLPAKAVRLSKGAVALTLAGRKLGAKLPALPVTEGPTPKLHNTAAKCTRWRVESVVPLPESSDVAVLLALDWSWTSRGKGPCSDKDYNDELAPAPERAVVFAR